MSARPFARTVVVRLTAAQAMDAYSACLQREYTLRRSKNRRALRRIEDLLADALEAAGLLPPEANERARREECFA